ncbi:MAG: hypothetical protein AABX08_00980 [Nanoarchaeota archaeon]
MVFFNATINSEDISKPGIVLEIYAMLNRYFTDRESILGVHANIEWRRLLEVRGDVFFVSPKQYLGPYVAFLQTDPNREAPTSLKMSLTFPPYADREANARERKLIADINQHVKNLLKQKGLEEIAIG